MSQTILKKRIVDITNYSRTISRRMLWSQECGVKTTSWLGKNQPAPAATCDNNAVSTHFWKEENMKMILQAVSRVELYRGDLNYMSGT